MIEGRVWKYGDDVNTDLIFPGRYTYILMDENEMAGYALEDLDEMFQQQAQKGDVIVAGKNWGCGSAREQAVKALCSKGIAAIVAKSFSRIYFRNALNEGLPVIICPEAAEAAEAGGNIRIHLLEHYVETAKGRFLFKEYDPYIQNMVACGGLIPFVKQEILNKEEKENEENERNIGTDIDSSNGTGLGGLLRGECTD